MNEVTLTFSGKKYHFRGPSSWEDLSEDHYLLAVALVNANLPAEKQALGLLAVREFLGIPPKVFKALDAEQAAQLLDTVQFVYQTPGPVSWKIRRVGDFFGPANKLSDVTFGEFIFAERFFSSHQVPHLIATLYRPLRETVGPDTAREAFEVNTIESRLPAARRLRPAQQQGILHNYLSCRAQLAKLFPHVFPPPAQDQETEERKQSAGGTWLDIALDLARKEQALGDFEKLQQQNLYLVLRLLDKVMDEHEKQLLELEKMERRRRR